MAPLQLIPRHHRAEVSRATSDPIVVLACVVVQVAQIKRDAQRELLVNGVRLRPQQMVVALPGEADSLGPTLG